MNRFTTESDEPYEPLRVDPAIEAAQHDRLARLRAERGGMSGLLAAMREAARRRRTSWSR